MRFDAGPNSATSFDVRETGLAARGRAIADIELLVLTHQHPDHQGLASSIVRRSGAQVAVLDRLAEPLADWAAYADRNDEFAHRLMARHSMAAEMTNVGGSARWRATSAPARCPTISPRCGERDSWCPASCSPDTGAP